jgi:phosphate transport system substrate-binding protein
MLKIVAFVAAMTAIVLPWATRFGAHAGLVGHSTVYASSAAFGEESLAVIVNKSNPVEDLSSLELRKIFLAERRTWPGGHKITVVMREPGQTEREAVLRLVCRMSDSDFNKYFLQLSFTGESQVTPKVLATAGGMLRFVFNVPGAIGYVRAGELDGSVKAVRVDGHAPGDSLYRLKLSLR